MSENLKSKLLEGFCPHISYARRSVRKSILSLSISKTGHFGISEKIAEKYNLNDKKSVCLFFDNKNKQIALQFFESEEGLYTVRKYPRAKSLSLVIKSFVSHYPENAGYYRPIKSEEQAGAIVIVFEKIG